MANKLNSRVDAINTLPDDLLGDILCLLSAMQQDRINLSSIESAWRMGELRRPSNVDITRVSRRWRLVSTDRRTIWLGLVLRGKLDLTRAPRVLNDIPEHVALHIRIEPEMEDEVQEGPQYRHAWRAVHPNELENALSAVATRTDQIRGLFARVYALGSFPVLLSSGLSFSNLMKLEISALATVDLNITATKLRKLDLMRTVPHDHVGWTELFTPHLHSLDLESHYGAVAYDVGMLDILFTSCPLLKQLNIGLYCSQLDGASGIRPGQWKNHGLEILSAHLPPKDAMRLLAGLGDISGIRSIRLGLRTTTDTDDDLALNLEVDPLPLVQILTAGLARITSFNFSKGSNIKMVLARHDSSTLHFVRSFSMANSLSGDAWDTTAIWRYLCTTFSAHRTIQKLRLLTPWTWGTMVELFTEVQPPHPDEGLTLFISADYLPDGNEGDPIPILVLPALKRVVFDVSTSEQDQCNMNQLSERLFASLSVQRDAGSTATEMCFCAWRRLYGERGNKWNADLDGVMISVRERGEEAMWTLCKEERVRKADRVDVRRGLRHLVWSGMNRLVCFR